MSRDRLLAVVRRIPGREILLLLLLALAAGLVVHGVSLLSQSAAWIVAGLLTAALAVLFLAEAG